MHTNPYVPIYDTLVWLIRRDPKSINSENIHASILCPTPVVRMGFSVKVRPKYGECESNAFTMGPLTNSI